MKGCDTKLKAAEISQCTMPKQKEVNVKLQLTNFLKGNNIILTKHENIIIDNILRDSVSCRFDWEVEISVECKMYRMDLIYCEKNSKKINKYSVQTFQE